MEEKKLLHEEELEIASGKAGSDRIGFGTKDMIIKIVDPKRLDSAALIGSASELQDFAAEQVVAGAQIFTNREEGKAVLEEECAKDMAFYGEDASKVSADLARGDHIYTPLERQAAKLPKGELF